MLLQYTGEQAGVNLAGPGSQSQRASRLGKGTGRQHLSTVGTGFGWNGSIMDQACIGAMLQGSSS